MTTSAEPKVEQGQGTGYRRCDGCPRCQDQGRPLVLHPPPPSTTTSIQSASTAATACSEAATPTTPPT